MISNNSASLSDRLIEVLEHHLAALKLEIAALSPTPAQSPEISAAARMAAAAKQLEGDTLLNQMQYERALACYSAAIELDPRNHTIFGDRCACHAKLSVWDAAVRDAAESVRLDPSYSEGWYRLATAQLELKQTDEALGAARKAMETESNESSESVLELLRAYEHTKLLTLLSGDLCSAEAMENALLQVYSAVDEARVRVAAHAFASSSSPSSPAPGTATILAPDFLRRGFVDFCTGSARRERLCVGECVMVKEQLFGCCPQKHPLTAFDTERDGYYCSICNKQVPMGSTLHGCRLCDFDLCDDCVKLPVTADAEEIGVVRDATVGVVRDATEGAGGGAGGGRVFSVAVRGGAVREGVPEAAVVRCENLDATAEDSVKDYLQALGERVGADDDAGGEKWKAQVPLAIKERWVQQGFLASMDDPEYEAELELGPWARSFEAWCEKPDIKASIDQLCEDGGWSLEEAGVIQFCGDYPAVLGASVRDSRPDYAALLHYYYRLLAGRAQGQEPAPVAYVHLQGGIRMGTGLADHDQGWADMVQGQGRGGFRAFTANSITAGLNMAECRNIAPGGRRVDDWESNQLVLVDSPVVRFVSRPSDASGLHTAVFTDPENLVFPPMTLFRVVKEEEPGWVFDGTTALVAACKWMFDGKAPTPVMDDEGRLSVSRKALWDWLEALEDYDDDGEYNRNDPEDKAWLDLNLFPAGADSTVYRVQQKLIEVEATYLLPTSATAPATATAAATTSLAASHGYSDKHAKLCEGASTLMYQDRRAYVRGLSEILFAPCLTMEQEWLRDKTWTDWKGRHFSSAEEWRYVAEERARNREPQAGSDEGHEGWDVAWFVREMNAAVGAAGGEALTTEEVIACRLYTGPGYDQINNAFLREVGGVDDRHWRQRLAQVPSYTYSATVAHLVSAIRKLSAVNTFAEGEEEMLLYRGIGGKEGSKLPDSFFEPDAQGMITAVDTGMMSTTSERQEAINFFKGKLAVLFVLHCRQGRDGTGAHGIGAVLTSLSQYPGEAETLFPPLTMLSVMKEGDGGGFQIYETTGRNKEGEEVAIKEIHVSPSFV